MTDETKTDEVKDDDDAPSAFTPFLTSVFVALAALAAVELCFRGSPVDAKLHKTNYITAKQAEFAKMGGDIVITGDSRMFHAVIPSVMQQALHEQTGQTFTTYNFGIPSGTTPIFLMAATAAAHQKPRPRVFVLGVTPALFTCCDAISAAGTQPAVTPEAVPWLVKAAWWANTEEAGAAIAYGASHLLAFRTEVTATYRDLQLPRELSFQDRGWVSMGGRVDPATQNVRAKGRAGAYADLMDKTKRVEKDAPRLLPAQFLAAAIEVLHRNHVKVVVVGTPQARQLDWYHDERHMYFDYLNDVKRVTAEHGVQFIDLNAPRGIESTDFIDGDHLSEPGAQIFTRLLATDVVLPLLR